MITRRLLVVTDLRPNSLVFCNVGNESTLEEVHEDEQGAEAEDEDEDEDEEEEDDDDDSASDRLDKYSWTRASRKLNTLSSSEWVVLRRGVRPMDESDVDPSPLLVVRIDELPDDELDEKLLEVDVLRASFDDRLAWRRWARRALHTSCSRKPSLAAMWKASNVCRSATSAARGAFREPDSRMPGVSSGVVPYMADEFGAAAVARSPPPPLPPIQVQLSSSFMVHRFFGSTVSRPASGQSRIQNQMLSKLKMIEQMSAKECF